MATNPYDFMGPILQRMQSLHTALNTDVSGVDQQAYDLLVLNLLATCVTLRIVQKIHPTIATDAAITAEFDNSLNLVAGQSWDTITKRIVLLGNDPQNNPWLPPAP
jgi:hypothetical protein